MKKKLGISLMLMLGLMLVGCADVEEYEASHANRSAGSGGQASQTSNQANPPADGSQSSESELESNLLDHEGTLSGRIVRIEGNQIILAPHTHTEISDSEVGIGDFHGDENDWITVTIDDDTAFLRDRIVQGVSQGTESTTFNDLFVDDTVRIAGELSGSTFSATEVTVLVFTH